MILLDLTSQFYWLGTESMSDQSDVEGRIHALAEQLRSRKMEADRLKREQKKKHKEHLEAREDSLRKQIEVSFDIVNL